MRAASVAGSGKSCPFKDAPLELLMLMTEAQEPACWVEVKPLITSELKPGNFAPILEALFNSAKPFKFLVVDTEDKNASGRQLVRFFIQFPNEQIKKQMSNVTRALLNIEVIAAEPPERQYQRHADLELAKDYALPICDFREKTEVNLIDRIVATIAGSDTAIEITAQGDSTAALGIQNYIYEKNHSKSSISKTFSDQAVGVLSEITVQRNTKNRSAEQTSKSGQQYKNDPWIKEVIKNAEMKLHSSLFTCNIRIHADSAEKVQATKNVLPSATNRFKVFKTEKKPSHAETRFLKKPSRYILRNTLLSRLWWITPLIILLLTGLLGVFNPIRLATSPGLTVDTVPLSAALFSAFALYISFRKRNPIVLSTRELAQIIGLPTAAEKLPVALGQVPASRMQLGSERNMKPEKNDNEQTLDQEEKEQIQKVRRAATHHTLPPFEPEEKAADS